MPPLMFFCGFGRVWRLIMFTPSTTTRFLSASTRSTRPRLPRSLPVAHDDHVVLADVRLHLGMTYRTSGASEMIFMNLRSRSSRATGPNTRVPIGSP